MPACTVSIDGSPATLKVTTSISLDAPQVIDQAPWLDRMREPTTDQSRGDRRMRQSAHGFFDRAWSKDDARGSERILSVVKIFAAALTPCLTQAASGAR